jgi:hypothetical protein
LRLLSNAYTFAHWKTRENTMATNLNKGALRVDLGLHWHQYAPTVPHGLTPLGTVTRKGVTQALAIDANGDYWAFGNGPIDRLPRQKVAGALAALYKAKNS